MEPITVYSKLDLNTYFKISILFAFKRPAMRILMAFFVLFLALSIYYGPVNWNSTGLFLVWGGLFFILMPVLTWYRCKRNMKLSPILTEGTTYTISNEFIQNVTSTSSCKTDWKVIKNAEEKDDHFILYTTMRAIHFLPKSGFASANDIASLKEMIKNNHIKAYFK